MNNLERLNAVNLVFTPGSPVHQRDLFSGRITQLQRVLDTLNAPGRHPVLFGQRGVGKTSLANILGQALQNMLTVKISCDGSDTFATVWNRVLRTASVQFKKNAFGFSDNDSTKVTSLADAIGHDAATTKPAEIAELLSRMTTQSVVILDEFDKLRDKAVKAAFADLIKIASDTAPLATIILVGVADNIHELIGEHESIVRNLVHVEVPLMSDEEINTIFTTGMKKLGVACQPEVLSLVPKLSGGFPHYAHLLGLASVKAVCAADTTHLTSALFDTACNIAVSEAIEKYRDAFARATATTQVSRYPKILSSCGFAKTDSRAVFRATDVVDSCKSVFGESLSVQAVVPALGEFLHPQRASVLRAVPVRGRQCYQFSDPMMRPYCRLKARELIAQTDG